MRGLGGSRGEEEGRGGQWKGMSLTSIFSFDLIGLSGGDGVNELTPLYFLFLALQASCWWNIIRSSRATGLGKAGQGRGMYSLHA